MSERPGRVLRPTGEEYAAWLRRPDPVTLLFVGVLVVVPLLAAVLRWVLGGGGAGVLLLLGLVVLGVVLGLGGALFSMRTTTVTLTGSTIEHRRWVVRRTVLPVDGLRGVLAPYRPPMSDKASELLVLQRADARGPRIRLNGAFWRHDDLVAIASAAGIGPEDEQVRARQVERRLPGILRLHERRPVLFVLAFPATIVALVLVGGLLSLALEDDASFPADAAREQDAVLEQVVAALAVEQVEESTPRVQECGSGPGAERTVGITGTPGAGGGTLREQADRVVAVVQGAGIPRVDGDAVDDAFEVVGTGPDGVFLQVERDTTSVEVTFTSDCAGD